MLAHAPQSAPSDGLGDSLFEASEDCVKLLSLDGTLLSMNVNGRCLMEIDDFEAFRGKAWHTLWPEAHQAAIRAAVAAAAGGQVARLTAACPTAKGTPKSWEVLVTPVFDDAGRPTRVVSISRDVTERLALQADKALLTRELDHRISNLFAIVDGVIMLSARGAVDGTTGFAAALRERFGSLARAFAYVTPSGREAAIGPQTLAGLLRVLLEPYGAGDPERLTVVGDDAPVGPTATTAVALVANELATNALKYGALAAAEGRVGVALTRVGTELRLVWAETGGGGQPAGEARAGFGTTLLDTAVTRQLGGRLEREWMAEGLRVTLWLPVERLAG